MRSTTEGMNVALMGLPWRPGDEVVTTQLEHICLFSVLALAARRYDVTVKTVDIGQGGGDVLDGIKRAVTPRTRAIAVSHLHWSSGAIMSLAEIAAFARERGIFTVIDAAQSVGQIPIDVKALDVDAYCIPGQKWLCGPSGTGALYLRKEAIGEVRPSYLRHGAFDAHGFVVPPDGVARYEMGDLSQPAILALTAGLKWLREEVNWTWAHERVVALGTRLADGLTKCKGVTVTTPRDRMAGIVCFTVEGATPQEITKFAFERGYTIRYVDQRPGPTAARASAGWWCTEDEVDELIKVVAELARDAAR
jgi:L-cysteine/cystine lyase